MQKISKFLASAAFMLPLSGRISVEPSFFSVEKNHQEKFHAGLTLSLKQSDYPQGKSVVFDVQRVEIHLHKGKTNARLRLLEDLGPIDLLSLGEKMQIQLAELNIPDDVKLSQVRLVLKDKGHFLVKKNGQKCALQFTGSDQRFVQMNKSVDFKAGLHYYMDLGLDLSHQIAVNENGGCYLKPSLHLANRLETLPIGEERGGLVTGTLDLGIDRSPANELILAEWKDIFTADIESTFGDGIY